jgi:REP element-mobilizing transposase RayT
LRDIGGNFDADDVTNVTERVDLLAGNCRAAGVAGWAWRLMPNHVHRVVMPSDPDGLRCAIARPAQIVL